MGALRDLMLPGENQQEMGRSSAAGSLSTFFSSTLGLFLIIHLSRERVSTAFAKKVLFSSMERIKGLSAMHNP